MRLQLKLVIWRSGMRKTTKERNGEKIYSFRKKNNLTIEQLSKIIGKSPTQVHRYEKGIHQVPKKVVVLLNNRFNLDIVPPKVLTGNYNKKILYRRRKNILKISDLNELDSKVLNKFAKLFRKIRKKEDLNLKQFSDKYDISWTHLWKLERGQAITLRITTLGRLKNAGYDLNELF